MKELQQDERGKRTHMQNTKQDEYKNIDTKFKHN